VIFLLDTDHVTLDQRGHPLVRTRMQATGSAQVRISIITVEEQLRGWLAVARGAATGERRVLAYHRLRLAIEYFASVTLVDYDRAADALVTDLRGQGVRIGTQDLRIAAIALTQGMTLVTRNRRDFDQIPGLQMEDWSEPAPP
jgi:tRNA(fMet)-specific endonuclease VapC